MPSKRFGIMLAQTPNPRNLLRNSYEQRGKYLLVQPKLNGERCRVEWFHGEPILLSSEGNVFNLPVIKEQLFNLPHFPWDGELYVHGWSREQIHSVCSTARKELHKDHAQLQFHIFDYQDLEELQDNRIHFLFQNVKDKNSNILMVSTSIIEFNYWLNQCQHYTSNGYEGIIIRNPAAPYQKKRTTDLLKFKPTEQDEYTIIDIEEAISKDGMPLSMVGAFIVQGDDGTPFKVGAGKLTHDKRRHYWFIQSTLPGKTLIVKHELIKTKNQIPVAAVAVEVKE